MLEGPPVILPHEAVRPPPPPASRPVDRVIIGLSELNRHAVRAESAGQMAEGQRPLFEPAVAGKVRGLADLASDDLLARDIEALATERRNMEIATGVGLTDEQRAAGEMRTFVITGAENGHLVATDGTRLSRALLTAETLDGLEVSLGEPQPEEPAHITALRQAVDAKRRELAGEPATPAAEPAAEGTADGAEATKEAWTANGEIWKNTPDAPVDGMDSGVYYDVLDILQIPNRRSMRAAAQSHFVRHPGPKPDPTAVSADAMRKWNTQLQTYEEQTGARESFAQLLRDNADFGDVAIRTEGLKLIGQGWTAADMRSAIAEAKQGLADTVQPQELKTTYQAQTRALEARLKYFNELMGEKKGSKLIPAKDWHIAQVEARLRERGLLHYNAQNGTFDLAAGDGFFAAMGAQDPKSFDAALVAITGDKGMSVEAQEGKIQKSIEVKARTMKALKWGALFSSPFLMMMFMGLRGESSEG